MKLFIVFSCAVSFIKSMIPKHYFHYNESQTKLIRQGKPRKRHNSILMYKFMNHMKNNLLCNIFKFYISTSDKIVPISSHLKSSYQILLVATLFIKICVNTAQIFPQKKINQQIKFQPFCFMPDYDRTNKQLQKQNL